MFKFDFTDAMADWFSQGYTK